MAKNEGGAGARFGDRLRRGAEKPGRVVRREPGSGRSRRTATGLGVLSSSQVRSSWRRARVPSSAGDRRGPDRTSCPSASRGHNGPEWRSRGRRPPFEGARTSRSCQRESAFRSAALARRRRDRSSGRRRDDRGCSRPRRSDSSESDRGTAIGLGQPSTRDGSRPRRRNRARLDKASRVERRGAPWLFYSRAESRAVHRDWRLLAVTSR